MEQNRVGGPAKGCITRCADLLFLEISDFRLKAKVICILSEHDQLSSSTWHARAGLHGVFIGFESKCVRVEFSALFVADSVFLEGDLVCIAYYSCDFSLR